MLNYDSNIVVRKCPYNDCDGTIENSSFEEIFSISNSNSSQFDLINSSNHSIRVLCKRCNREFYLNYSFEI
jgi:hypothetical protein